jgi:hypothetical protein
MIGLRLISTLWAASAAFAAAADALVIGPVPAEVRAQIRICDEPADPLSAKVVKGGAILTQLSRDAGDEGVRVQRIVRLD